MIITMIFGAIISALTLTTYSFDDCKERDFKPKACKAAEFLDKK